VAEIIQATDLASSQIKEFDASSHALNGVQKISCASPELQTARRYIDFWNDLVSTLQTYAHSINEDCQEMTDFVQALQTLDQEARVKHDTWNVEVRYK